MDDTDNDTEKALGALLRAAFDDTVSEGVPETFQRLIDENLKKAFDDTVAEPVPDRFVRLLARLRDQSGP